MKPAEQPPRRNRPFRSGALLCAFALTATAQVSWVPNSGGPANPVLAGIAANGTRQAVCRFTLDGIAYTGTAVGSVCRSVKENLPLERSTFEVAVNLATWESTTPDGKTPVAAGLNGPELVRPCRVAASGLAGVNLAREAVCRVNRDGVVENSTTYELLYDITVGDEFRVFASNGLCVGMPPNSVTPAPVVPCSNPITRLQLQSVANQIFQLRLLGTTNVCLGLENQLVTRSTCGTSTSRLRFMYRGQANSFRPEFEIGGSAWQSPGAIVSLAPPSTSNLQGFAIRSIPDVARRLKVVSYNTMMLTSSAAPSIRNGSRGRWIAEAIHSEDADADVLAISEAFDDGQLLALGRDTSGYEALRDRLRELGFPYFSDRPGSVANGGVLVFSRWPITEQDTNIFNDCLVGSLDCFTSKGISYARINKLGRVYNVMSTHLQADDGILGSAWETRKKQLREMREWVAIKVPLRFNEPVILAGDTNVDMESTPAEATEMFTILSASFPNAPRPIGRSSAADPFRWTVDPDVNLVTRDRGAGYSWLDYILFVRPYLQPLTADWVVKGYKRFPAFDMILPPPWVGGLKDYNDLSDHQALVGSFVFPFAALGAAEDPTVPITFQPSTVGGGTLDSAPLVVNGQQYLMPVTLRLNSRQTHSIGTPEIPASGGQRFVFQRWNNGSGANWQLVNPSQEAVFRAEYRQQFRLTLTASPSICGTLTGDGWFDSGTRTVASATPATGFRFVNWTGGPQTTDRNPLALIMDRAWNLVGNFSATGTPVLFAVSGPRMGSLATQRSVTVGLRNDSPFPAVNARITSITGVRVTAGSGVVTLQPTVLPINLGGLPALNGLATVVLNFNWPVTATRIQFTVHFAADGGYAGSTTLNVLR